MQIQFTQITATNCLLTKTFIRDSAGHIESTAIAHMTEGYAKVVEIGHVSELSTVLALLESNQAITCGVPQVGNTPLTTRAGTQYRTDAVARTNEAFEFPYGAALFPIDVDTDSAKFQTVNAVLDALEACSPWLKHIARIGRPSSSSYVGDRGLRGVHVYLVVTRGTDIPALAKRMQMEQWAAGVGHVKISKSGALLVRQLADALVYQPSRLMFEAAPVLTGVDRVVPPDQRCVERPPQVIGAPTKYRTPEGFLDVQSMPPQRDIESRRFETAVRNAKNSRRREAKRIAIDYQKTNAIANGLDPAQGERYGLLATRALGDKALPVSWVLQIEDLGQVTVGQVLENLPLALGMRCADPFDTWRPDLAPKHFTKAEIVSMGDAAGVWSHKLQEFFAFTHSDAADLSNPLDLAAEKLCGLIEYPEPVGKKTAPFVNVKFGLELLLREIDALPRHNVSTDYTDLSEVPDVGRLVDALSRIGCANVTPGPVERALEVIADVHQYDPWRDMVQALPQWDKVGRLDTFFTDLCGALPSDALTLVGQAFFAGLVMRQLHPGITAPVVPVLIGGQGMGKGRFIADLAAAMGVPKPSSLVFDDPRKMSMKAARSMVAELAEMSGLAKKDSEEVKQWISDDVDRYRRPYDKQEIEHLRRFMLLGTANKHELNRDATGNRRLLPIHVLHTIERGWAVECHQLLAEAKDRFCKTQDDYLRMVDTAQRAVFAANAVDMLRGEGTPVTDLDDLLPPILRAQVKTTGKSKVQSTAIRIAIDQHGVGRQFSAQKIAQWMQTRGWERATDSAGMRYYIAPKDFIDEIDTTATLAIVSPFRKESVKA